MSAIKLIVTARGAPPPRALARQLRASLGPQALLLVAGLARRRHSRSVATGTSVRRAFAVIVHDAAKRPTTTMEVATPLVSCK
jgi:hypothetical protein